MQYTPAKNPALHNQKPVVVLHSASLSWTSDIGKNPSIQGNIRGRRQQTCLCCRFEACHRTIKCHHWLNFAQQGNNVVMYLRRLLGLQNEPRTLKQS